MVSTLRLEVLIAVRLWFMLRPGFAGKEEMRCGMVAGKTDVLCYLCNEWKVEDGNYFIIDCKEQERPELVQRVKRIVAAVMGETMSNFTVKDKCGCQ